MKALSNSRIAVVGHSSPVRPNLYAALGFLILLVAMGYCAVAAGYPVDGFKDTGIRRLARLERLAVKDELYSVVPGGMLPSSAIKLHLLDAKDGSVWPREPDPELQQGLDAIFPDRDASYAVGLLDITAGRPPRYAGRQEERTYSPGSVGKLAIAAGLFTELARLYPDSIEKRQALLRNRMVTAGVWIHADPHDVPIYNPATGEYVSRPIREGDVFSLYEWTDHMLSASANAAASTVWKEVMLMRRFGKDYPPTAAEEKKFFATAGRNTLRDLAMAVVNEPLRAMGIRESDWQLGSFFTARGKKMVPPGGMSYANVRGFLTFLVSMERGKLVDEWSSLELKKLLYMTINRIRYASSPALRNAAVFFKSGSWYHCKPEKGFSCGKYRGNVDNYMNSVVIVEHPDGRTYLVALLSNVLRKNSAVEHQTLATFIDRLIAPPVGDGANVETLKPEAERTIIRSESIPVGKSRDREIGIAGQHRAFGGRLDHEPVHF